MENKDTWKNKLLLNATCIFLWYPQQRKQSDIYTMFRIFFFYKGGIFTASLFPFWSYFCIWRWSTQPFASCSHNLLNVFLPLPSPRSPTTLCSFCIWPPDGIRLQNLHLISFLMIPNLAIFSQYFLGNYQFSSCLSAIELICLPQPEAALFWFESSGTADMSESSARATNLLSSIVP